jgi:uncharacterized protein
MPALLTPAGDSWYVEFSGLMGCVAMSRLIVIFAIVAVVYFLLRSYFKRSPKADTPESSEEMVRCVQCGVHLPKSEAILAGGEYFCCEAHRRDRAGRSE